LGFNRNQNPNGHGRNDDDLIGNFRGDFQLGTYLASGKLTVCELENGPFIVDLPSKNGDFPVHFLYVETRYR
jgi:hypothetical protein